MKVLFVSSGNSDYGIVPFVKNQGESLKKAGVELEFFTVIGKGIKGYLKNINRLKKQINKNDYDVIHAHYSLIALVTLLTFSRKPLVISLMGSDAYGDYDEKGRRVFSSYFPMIITQIVQPFAKAIIVKSGNIKKYVYSGKKTHIVPNGVNFERFQPMDKNECRRKLNLSPEQKIVLFLANPEDPRKNYKLLKEAESFFDKRGIEIINPFPIKNKDFPLYLNACDVFVLTSYNEGSPNVIKEAMACNCPIVATDVGDVKEVISGVEGCYLTSFDPEDLAEKLKKAIEFGGRTRGRKHINHLKDENVANKIIKIYESILNEK